MYNARALVGTLRRGNVGSTEVSAGELADGGMGTTKSHARVRDKVKRGLSVVCSLHVEVVPTFASKSALAAGSRPKNERKRTGRCGETTRKQRGVERLCSRAGTYLADAARYRAKTHRWNRRSSSGDAIKLSIRVWEMADRADVFRFLKVGRRS